MAVEGVAGTRPAPPKAARASRWSSSRGTTWRAPPPTCRTRSIRSAPCPRMPRSRASPLGLARPGDQRGGHRPGRGSTSWRASPMNSPPAFTMPASPAPPFRASPRPRSWSRCPRSGWSSTTSPAEIAQVIAASVAADPAGDLSGGACACAPAPSGAAPRRSAPCRCACGADGTMLTVGDVATVSARPSTAAGPIGSATQAIVLRVDRSRAGDAIGMQRDRRTHRRRDDADPARRACGSSWCRPAPT
jgi:hypothetical protein